MVKCLSSLGNSYNVHHTAGKNAFNRDSNKGYNLQF